ncbi:MAG: sugar phosphate isomerase/epimerase family protein [Planctomycetota bacterium]
MPRLSMNELTTFRWSFDEDLFHYSRAGYDAVGVWRRKLADFGEERGAELLADSGMAVSNLLWAGGFTGNDGRSLAESVADGQAAIRTASVINAGCLVLYTGGRNNHTSRHAQRLVRSALEDLLVTADEYDVTLAIEPMHTACAGEWSVLTTLEDTVDLLADFASPRLKLVYDTYHFPLPERELPLLCDLTPMIAVVHLGDARTPHGIDQERCPLGSGRAPVSEMISTLLEAGYEGDFDIELMGPTIEASDYESVLRSSRDFFQQSVQSAGLLRR